MTESQKQATKEYAEKFAYEKYPDLEPINDHNIYNEVQHQRRKAFLAGISFAEKEKEEEMIAFAEWVRDNYHWWNYQKCWLSAENDKLTTSELLNEFKKINK